MIVVFLINFDIEDCQELADMNAVKSLMIRDTVFNVRSSLTLEERLINIAQRSAAFKIQVRENRDSFAMDLNHADQTLFSDRCSAVPKSQVLAGIMKQQYTLATAATIMLIELAAASSNRVVEGQ